MPSPRRLCALALPVAMFACGHRAHAQDDGGTYTPTDGGGNSVLESIYVPNLPDAPFTLTLHTEWLRPLPGGSGSLTLVNDRPLARDTAGRIYQERWLLTPKGSNIPSRMSAIQIDDPVAHLFYTCMVRTKTCEISTSVFGLAHYDSANIHSGPLKDGKGTFQHEDLGTESLAGLLCHGYRDTTTLNAGVLGNDAPMTTTREFFYNPELGFNLSSTLDSALTGRQLFTVATLSTTPPDPKLFDPPQGYKLVDKRKPHP